MGRQMWRRVVRWSAVLGVLAGILAIWPAHGALAATGMAPGQTLSTGGKLYSPDGHYVLIMQDDGNLVDYAWPRPLWASNTTNHPYSVLEMQTDGNLVVYGQGHVPIWASNTGGHPGAYLEMQNDANMVIRASNGAVIWASGATDARLDGGQALQPGWQFQSPDRQYRLVMQTDGNLVLYKGGTALWASNTHTANSEVEMQTDGNLVIYAPGHIAVWATGTFNQYSALLGQNDGNFVVYAPGNKPVWATNTSTVKPVVPSSTPATLTSCPTMRQGSAGSCVLLLQQSLNSAGGVSPTLTPDGNFGPLTRQAVVSYQTSRGLTVDGVAGPQTLQALVAHKQPVSAPAPPVHHNYPASFNPAAAASWAVANALVSLPVPENWRQLFTGDKEPCTTFVSWAVAKGGMPEEADWFPYWDSPSTQHSVFLYMSSNTPVPAWYAANNFVARFTGLGWASQRQTYPGPSAPVSIGDVIYYQWDGTPNHPHLAIVTSIQNGQVRVTDQGAATLYPSSINRDLFFDHNGKDLRTIPDNAHMKIYVLHWQ
jgi:hypothetical protein